MTELATFENTISGLIKTEEYEIAPPKLSNNLPLEALSQITSDVILSNIENTLEKLREKQGDYLKTIGKFEVFILNTEFTIDSYKQKLELVRKDKSNTYIRLAEIDTLIRDTEAQLTNEREKIKNSNLTNKT